MGCLLILGAQANQSVIQVDIDIPEAPVVCFVCVCVVCVCVHVCVRECVCMPT